MNAPGPRDHRAIANLVAFRRDVLALMMRSRAEYGDVVRVRLGPIVVHLVSDPELAETILKNREGFDKATRSSRMIRHLTGPSVLVTDGAEWERARALMQNAMAPHRMLPFADVIARTAREMVDRWAGASSSASIDVSSEMMGVTYRVVERVLFSSEAPALDEIEHAMTDAIRWVYRRLEGAPGLPRAAPTPANRRFEHAVAVLDRRVTEIVAARRRDRSGGDLLSILLDAAESDGHTWLDDRRLRNEIVTLLAAGHETTANALTWTWAMLAEHPEVEDQAVAEVDEVLGGRAPTADDVPRLRWLWMVVREAMRLRPPIWAIIRRATGPATIGGYDVTEGSRVVISPHVIHRHPAHWTDPERFDPTRFTESAIETRHRSAYLPFGTGPRFCVGHALARIEAVVIVATVLQRYRLRRVDTRPLVADPGITMRVRGGLPMTAEPRT